MHLAFVTPSPNPVGGGSSFNAGLIPALRGLGATLDIRHAGLPPSGVPVIDGMVLPDLVDDLPALVARDAVVIVHHVSAKAGRDAATRDAVREIERRMLPSLRRVVATSQPVADRLSTEFGLAPLLLPPGHPVLPRSPGGAAASSCALLAVGVFTPRKGHDRLLTALSRLTDLDWTLTIAGDDRRDPACASGLAAQIDTLGLQGRVTLLPRPDDAALDHAWRTADLFALATEWEGYPSGIAEALRRGLPIVAPGLPSIVAMVPQAAGVLYPPGDAVTFGKCLRRTLCDRALRTELADAAWQAGTALPGWDQQARAFISILEG